MLSKVDIVGQRAVNQMERLRYTGFLGNARVNEDELIYSTFA